MYEYITGKSVYRGNDYIVIENGGIGYKIFTSASTLAASVNDDSDIRIYTYLYVREDVFALYGFITREELNMFKLLITVSGVGPKASCALISALTPSAFGYAVVSEDADALAKAQGIGKKLAQKIILELKDKIAREKLQQEYADNSAVNTAAVDIMAEAVNALMVLGYTSLEANRAVSRAYHTETDLQNLIRNSLKEVTGR